MEALNLKGKKVSVLGFGRSGLASSKRLASLGADILVSEERPKENFDQGLISEIEGLGVKTEFNGHTDKVLDKTSLIVLSPGVHLDIPILEKAKLKGIKVISEIELAFLLLTKPIIAVTGTNGKTTTATLINEILNASGKRSVAAGNIGFPLSFVNDRDLDFIVAEISSYQLEAIEKFKPRISLILNITEDHLERHRTMREYSLLKARVFSNQGKGDYVVYNADDRFVSEIVASAKAKLVPFSRKKILDEGISVDSGRIIIRLKGRTIELMDAEDIFIKGEHNTENALAGAAAAYLAGANEASITKTLRKFKGVEHRIEFVTSISGVSFYNDSKGTNPDSTVVALKALKNNIILIAGGRDKMGDLSQLISEAKGRVKALILIGEAAERFNDAFSRSGFSNIFTETSMEGAVKKAMSFSKPGDQVLFSPACASFDMFKDYEERGKVFKDLVLSLKKVPAR